MTCRHPILTWHPRRAVFLLLGAGFYAVTEFGRFVLRPYVREHGIDDLGFTGSIGNGGGILVQILLACAVINPDRRRIYVLALPILALAWRAADG